MSLLSCLSASSRLALRAPQINTVSMQRRNVMIEYVKQLKNGKLEDPMYTSMRLNRADEAEGFTRRFAKYRFYEKPTKRRQRIKSEQIYRHKKREVMAMKEWVEAKHKNDVDK